MRREVFVGRAGESAELRAAVRLGERGRGAVCLITGDAGIGKTRLAERAMAYAASRGLRVLRGRCAPGRDAPPYWPWVEAMGPFLRASRGARARRLDGELMRGETAVLSPAAEPGSGRWRLWSELSALLLAAAARRVIAVLLEDLQWADEGSLGLLRFLAPRIAEARLLVVGTCRSSPALDALSQETSVRRIPLSGLSPGEVERLVRSALPEAADAARSVFEATAGSPLFADHLLRLLEAGGGPERLPEGIREVLALRRARLGETARHVLTAAAVIGREAPLRALSAVEARTPRRRLDLAVKEAASAHFLRTTAEPEAGVQFTHELVRSSVLDALGEAERMRLHARAGEALEKVYAGDIGAHAAELFGHFSRADALAGARKIARYALLAGERALSAQSYDEALSFFRAGLRVRAGEAPDGEKARLLYGEGRCLAGLLRDREAAQSLERAFDFFREQGDMELAVAVASTPFTLDSETSARMGSRALALVPPQSREAGRILVELGGARAYFERDGTEGTRMLLDAVRIARVQRDPELELAALLKLIWMDQCHGRAAGGVRRARRAVVLAVRLEDADAEARARYTLADLLKEVGEPDEVRRQVRLLEKAASRSGAPAIKGRALFQAISVAYMDGDLAAARRSSDALNLLLPENGGTGSGLCLYNRVRIECLAGDLAAARRFRDRLVAVHAGLADEATQDHLFIGMGIVEFAESSGEPDMLPLARACLEEALGKANPELGLRALDALARRALADGDVLEARRLYRTAPLTGLTRARVARALGRREEAAACLEGCLSGGTLPRDRSLTGDAPPQDRWLAARVRLELAELLVERAEEGDRDRAATLLREARRMSREAGMLPVAAAVDRTMRALSGWGRTRECVSLTRRETEVLRLLSTGTSDKEIAYALGLSRRTVQHHVASVLRKTGSANRTQASHYALEHSTSGR